MISDDRAEKAVEFIRDNAAKLAHARANQIYLEEYKKTMRATLVQDVQGTVLDRESYAYSHQDYVAVLDGLKEAVAQYEELRWKFVAEEATVEVWRTQSANARTEIKSSR